MTGYFDAATAAPLHPVARQALLAALDDGWADPDRLYPQARRARQLLDAARASIADNLGVRVDELFLAGSGTEAAWLAVTGVRAARRRLGHTVVHSAVEHSAVLKAAATSGVPASASPPASGPAAGGLPSGGAAAVEIGVDRLGRVDLEAFVAAARRPGVVLAAVQSANHEVGTVQPIAAVVAALGDVPLYVDAAQSVGRQPVPPGWALLSASARKWGGPAGVGVLAVRKGTRWVDPRPSVPPVNLPLLVAAAAALRAVSATAAADAARLSALIDRVRATVAATVPDVEVVGDPVDRLPHLVTFSCLYVDGEALLHALAREGFAVSSGSACTSDTLRPSHVLAAMGVLTHGNVRLSLPLDATDDQVDHFLAALPAVISTLRAETGATHL